MYVVYIQVFYVLYASMKYEKVKYHFTVARRPAMGNTLKIHNQLQKYIVYNERAE